jgi:hypothetical protein
MKSIRLDKFCLDFRERSSSSSSEPSRNFETVVLTTSFPIPITVMFVSENRPGFDPRSAYVGFVVDKAALGQVFSKYLFFPCQFSFHHLLRIH